MIYKIDKTLGKLVAVEAENVNSLDIAFDADYVSNGMHTYGPLKCTILKYGEAEDLMIGKWTFSKYIQGSYKDYDDYTKQEYLNFYFEALDPNNNTVRLSFNLDHYMRPNEFVVFLYTAMHNISSLCSNGKEAKAFIGYININFSGANWSEIAKGLERLSEFGNIIHNLPNNNEAKQKLFTEWKGKFSQMKDAVDKLSLI